MQEEGKAKTAFVSLLGFWEFNHEPQGIISAPTAFQRKMRKCMENFPLKEPLVSWMIIIFSSILEEREARFMDRLMKLTRLKEHVLKLSPE